MLSIGVIIALFIFVICLISAVFSYTTSIVFFDINHMIFDLGIRLKRFEEYTENYEQGRVRKELIIGFLFGKVVINYVFPKELTEVDPHELT